MRMVVFRWGSVSRRTVLILLFVFLSLILVLPTQSRGLLQYMGGPVADVVTLPLRGFAALTDRVGEYWEGYVALHRAHVDNQRLRREIEFLRGQNTKLLEAAAAGLRWGSFLGFKERAWPKAVAAEVIGRDSTNWYRGVLLDRGTQDGVHADLGVLTQAGLVGQVVKVTPSSSVVLLISDPNIAVTALVQRTRDEGIVTGTPRGLVRLKYIPLLSTIRKGDVVVTSGLMGKFPKGLMIGTVTRIEKTEDEPFQSAELAPIVDFSKLEEVLVVPDPQQS